MNWIFLGVITLASLLLCAVGFYRFLWFISVGYGFAILGVGIATGVLALTGLTLGAPAWNIAVLLQCIMFIVYGIRLGGFLFVREIKNAGYQKTMKTEISNDAPKKTPIFVSIALWLVVGVIYVAQSAGVVFRVMNGDVKGTANLVFPLVGFVVMALGVCIEALADKQKSAQKKEDPKMVATKGLYKFVRCPNYFGEILFWTGTFFSGINTYHTVGMWVVAILGYIEIVYVMFNGATRLEKRQATRLAGDPRYEEYADKTPIIIPFLPIYHLYDAEKDAQKQAKKAAKKAAKEKKN